MLPAGYVPGYCLCLMRAAHSHLAARPPPADGIAQAALELAPSAAAVVGALPAWLQAVLDPQRRVIFLDTSQVEGARETGACGDVYAPLPPPFQPVACGGLQSLPPALPCISAQPCRLLLAGTDNCASRHPALLCSPADFNATLPVMMGEFLLLMVFLDKFWFGPVGATLDARDKELRGKLGLVKDNGAAVGAAAMCPALLCCAVQRQLVCLDLLLVAVSVRVAGRSLPEGSCAAGDKGVPVGRHFEQWRASGAATASTSAGSMLACEQGSSGQHGMCSSSGC